MKFMKKLFIVLLILLNANLSISMAKTISAKREIKKEKIKLGTIAPRGTPWANLANHLKKRIKKNSKGELIVKCYLGGVMGGEKAMVKECKNGTLTIYGGSTALLTGYASDLKILDLPYLFSSAKEVDYILEQITPEIKKILYDNGFVFIEWAENGFFGYGTTKCHIKSPKDLVGLKMRSHESEIYKTTYKTFGAEPVFIAATEVLSALQANIVVGFENTPLFSIASSWYQAIKYYTIANQRYQATVLVASRKWWDNATPEFQKAMMHNAKPEGEKYRKEVRKLTPSLIQSMQKSGIDVYSLTQKEKESFFNKSEKVHKNILKQSSAMGKKLYQKIMQSIQKFKKQNS